MRQHLQGPVPVTLVLVRACRPIGSVSLVRYQRIGGLSPSHWVANVFLLPEHRNLGFGRVLMAGVERYAGEQGVGELLLYATDRADFYRHLGWELVRRKKVGGKPAFIFRRQLGSLE
nr:GNAT family N-acetyltransferase [Pseudomaricurvus alkylphenolicus]